MFEHVDINLVLLYIKRNGLQEVLLNRRL